MLCYAIPRLCVSRLLNVWRTTGRRLPTTAVVKSSDASSWLLCRLWLQLFRPRPGHLNGLVGGMVAPALEARVPILDVIQRRVQRGSIVLSCLTFTLAHLSIAEAQHAATSDHEDDDNRNDDRHCSVGAATNKRVQAAKLKTTVDVVIFLIIGDIFCAKHVGVAILHRVVKQVHYAPTLAVAVPLERGVLLCFSLIRTQAYGALVLAGRPLIFCCRRKDMNHAAAKVVDHVAAAELVAGQLVEVLVEASAAARGATAAGGRACPRPRPGRCARAQGQQQSRSHFQDARNVLWKAMSSKIDKYEMGNC